MADDRRARLAALAAKAGRKLPSRSDNDDEMDAEETEKVSVKFRNYAPRDEKLDITSEQGHGQKKGNHADLSVDDRLESIVQKTKKRRTEETEKAEEKPALDVALLEAKREVAVAKAALSGKSGGAGEDVSMLAPKKVNWDLKRDLKPKLDRLERRTQRAIVELLRERLEREAEQEADELGDNVDDDLD